MLVTTCVECDKEIHDKIFEIVYRKQTFVNGEFNVKYSEGVVSHCSLDCVQIPSLTHNERLLPYSMRTPWTDHGRTYKVVGFNLDNVYDQSISEREGWRKDCDSCGSFVDRKKEHIEITIQETEYHDDGTCSCGGHDEEVALFCCDECAKEYMEQLRAI